MENMNEALDFLSKGKRSGNVLSFSDFLSESEDANTQIIPESSGYGDLPFVYFKHGDAHNYMFKIDGDDSKSFVLTVGKFSKFAQPAEAKTSYAVLSITELPAEEFEQAIIDDGKFTQNEDMISATDIQANKILNQIAICIGDYLQKSPKTIKFYDEMQATLRTSEYEEKFKMSLTKWPGGSDAWKLQVVEKDKLNIITK